MLGKLLAAVAACFVLAGAAQAADEPQLTPEQKAEIQKMIALRDSLRPVHGTVTLPEAKATLNLGKGYYFLGAADARKVLVDGWGNPADAADGVLGLVFPEGRTFLDDTWGAVVTYEKTFYVSDKDAQSADYAQLMEDMKAAAEEANAERQKRGFEPVHVMGWAQPPAYDAARHDLIWARELQFGQQQEDHGLNYDVRHLGRESVLSLNMVSTMAHLGEIRPAAIELAKTAEFNAGQRYADFKAGDKEAGYGLAGLVAAGAGLAVAKKIGLLGVILLFAKKGIALIAIAGAAIAAWFRKLFGRKPSGGAPA